MNKIPKDYPVKPLKNGAKAADKVTCGNCGLSWDDAIVTGMTPAPSARCPFEMFHQEPTTTVIFRKFSDGEVIALFPNEPATIDPNGPIMSYMHMGQHGGADYYPDGTVPATEPEYRALKNELESLGYKLEVKKKRMRK